MVEDVVIVDHVGLAQIQQHQIGKVALANVAAILHLEALGHRMGGLLDDGLQGEYAVMVELQQCLQRVLHQRHTGRRLEVAVLLLLPGVGGVVGSDDVEHIITHRIEQRVLIGGTLHRRVALDLAAEGVVIGLVEEQMVNTHLGCDVLVFQFTQIVAGGKERQLLGRGQMQHMQLGAVLLGQRHRHAGGFVARLVTADAAMLAHRHILAPLGPRRLFQHLDGRGVFAVSNDHHRTLAEDGRQGLLIVHQHVAGRGAHEHLDPAGLLGVETLDLFQVVVGGTQIEAVVGDGGVGGDLVFGFEGVEGGGLGIDVGHFHETGGTTGDGGPGFTGDGSLVGQPRFPEVDLIIDHSGDEVATCGIDHHRIVRVDIGCDAGNPFPLDQHVGGIDTAFVDQGGILDKQFVHGGFQFLCR